MDRLTQRSSPGSLLRSCHALNQVASKPFPWYHDLHVIWLWRLRALSLAEPRIPRNGHYRPPASVFAAARALQIARSLEGLRDRHRSDRRHCFVDGRISSLAPPVRPGAGAESDSGGFCFGARCEPPDSDAFSLSNSNPDAQFRRRASTPPKSRNPRRQSRAKSGRTPTDKSGRTPRDKSAPPRGADAEAQEEPLARNSAPAGATQIDYHGVLCRPFGAISESTPQLQCEIHPGRTGTGLFFRPRF